MKRTLKSLVVTLAMATSCTSETFADTLHTVTEVSYDALNRPLCTAVRMNEEEFATVSTGACDLKVPHSADYGPDRITRNVYDAAGQVTEVWRAVGINELNGFPSPNDLEQRYAAYTYSANGQKTSETDARGNKTTLSYDGFDRLERMRYPHPLNIGQSNDADDENYTYDSNGNRKTFQRRDDQTINYQYDSLNREIYRDIPGGANKDVYTVYDLSGRILSKSFNGAGNANGVFYTYDILGRLQTSTDKAGRAVAYQYNAASGRTRITYPGSSYVNYTLDNLNRLRQASLNGSNVLFAQAYALTGQRRKLARGMSIADSEAPDDCVTVTNVTCYTYDKVGRLIILKHDPSATDYDAEWTFQYNPAQQLINIASGTTAYDYRQPYAALVDKTFDGLNRDNTVTVVAGGYDARGNLTNEGAGGRAFTYDVENRLLTATGAGPNLTLEYDAEGRLYKKTSGTDVTSYIYDGVNLIAEMENEGTTYRRRYVHGTGVDEPLVWFDGTGTSSPRYFWQNYQGSIVAFSNDQGVVQELYKYGPYGEPKTRVNAFSDTDSWSGAPFRYTGQVMLGDARLYYYKARVYDPNHARFLQTDPIGSKDDLNLYGYVKGDPVNKTDPTGLSCTGAGGQITCQIDKVVEGKGKDGIVVVRDATASDHKKYAAFEKAYTRAARAAANNGDKTATISYKGDNDKAISFKITGTELAKSMSARTVAADAGNTMTGAASQNRTDGIGGRSSISYMGSDTLTGRGAGTSIAHESIHNSRQSGGNYAPLNDDTQKRHQDTYNHAAQCLTGGGAC